MTKRNECVNCAHYEECDRPQGKCNVTKQSKLAWYGCVNNYKAKESEGNCVE